MPDVGLAVRSRERLSPDRSYRTRGDTLLAFSARATSSIRPVLLRGRGPRNVCGRYERGRPIRHRDIGAAADHPRWPRSTVSEALLLAELSSCGGNKLRIRVRVTGEAPAAVRSLGERHPDPLLHSGSPAAAPTGRVSSATSASCFSRSRPPALVSTWTR